MSRELDRAARMRSAMQSGGNHVRYAPPMEFSQSNRRGAETTAVSERNRAKNLRLALIRRAAERKTR